VGRQPYEIVFFFLAAAAVAGFFLAGILSGILSMLRFRASMMSTTLPPRSGAGAEMVTSLPLLFSHGEAFS
jgi:hypothetical protein